MEIILVLASFASLVALAAIVYPFKPFRTRRVAIYAFIGCFILVGIASPPLEEAENNRALSAQRPSGDPLFVPSDASAKYFVIGIEKRTDGLIEIATRREGSSGTSFAIRLVQCDPLRFGYIAESDRKEGLTRAPSPTLTKLVTGSISDVVSRYACAHQDARVQLAALTSSKIEAGAPDSPAIDAAKRAKLEGNVRRSVDILNWSDARSRYQMLSQSGLLTTTFQNDIEARMLALVRPLPAREREANLQGYEFLVAVRPDKPEYAAKVSSYKAAIQQARERAVTRLRPNEDRVGGITWYQHPNKPKYANSRSTAYLYIGQKNNVRQPWLRMKVIYTANRWLFVNKVTAWHDGVKEPLVAGNFQRDNNADIWEWMDVSPDNYQIEVLRSLANANEAILRFEGQQYHKDVTLSAGDKRAIREVLEAYEVMRSRT